MIYNLPAERGLIDVRSARSNASFAALQHLPVGRKRRKRPYRRHSAAKAPFLAVFQGQLRETFALGWRRHFRAKLLAGLIFLHLPKTAPDRATPRVMRAMFDIFIIAALFQSGPRL
jgi:hypothetical protein